MILLIQSVLSHTGETNKVFKLVKVPFFLGEFLKSALAAKEKQSLIVVT